MSRNRTPKTFRWRELLGKELSLPLKLLITLLVPLSVFACHFLAMARQAANPPHLREIVDELCSIRLVSGRPAPNHAGTKVLFFRYSTNNASWDICLHDVENRTTIYIDHGSYWTSVIWGWKILGWSPDDRFFAYVRSGYSEVVVCDGNSGAELSVKKCTRCVLTGTWTTPEDLVCSDGKVIDAVSLVRGEWRITPFSKASADSENKLQPGSTNNLPSLLFSGENDAAPGLIQLLSPFVTNLAVWQRSDALWMGKRGEAPRELWRGTNITLKEFSFSAAAKKFLLHCADNQGDFLVDLHPSILDGANSLTNIVRLETGEYQPRQVTIINGGKGFIYLNHNNVSLDSLVVKMAPSSPPRQIPWKAGILNFEVNGSQLYLDASSTNEPAGIWRYDLISGSSECLVSSMEKPFRYASVVPITQGFVTNAAGERLTYYLLQPAIALGKKKHPMVVSVMGIAEKGYVWDRYMQTISSCGDYFVCVDRHKRDAMQWAEDALCVYEYLARNFAVDTNKVYLFGVSAGAPSVDRLLQKEPTIWKGAIYFSAGRFSYYPGLSASRILLDIGADDEFEDRTKQQLCQSQDTLAGTGIRPVLVIRPGVGHVSGNLVVERERLLELAEFIQQP